MTIHSSIVCTYLYVITRYGYPPPAKDTLSHIDQMADLGFQSIELEGIRSEHNSEMHALRFNIRNKIDERNVTVPYYCVVLPGLSSYDEHIRNQNLLDFRLGCETAAELGSLGVLDNAPLPPYVFPEDIPVVRHYDEDVLRAARFPSHLDWNTYWKALTATYARACDIAAEYDLTYLMHPCSGVLAATTDAFLYFRDAVGRDNLRFNYDTSNQFSLKDNLDLALIRLAPYVDYIHISDTRGQTFEHLEPSEGIIDWAAWFQGLKRIGFKGHIGIDVGGEHQPMPDIDAV